MAPQKNYRQTIEVAKRNWQAEVETAQTYRDLAERERDEKRKGILLRMAEAEERHALRWEAKLKELGAGTPVYEDTFSRRLNRWWNKIAGAEIAIRRMEATEERQEAEFHDQAERTFAGEQDVQEFLRKSAIEEKAHARTLSAMAPSANPRTALDKILKRERWHGRGGSWVADAIYGANDGLGAVFGIVSGVAGATNNQQHYILISGLAGMLASTLSMGAGAYLAAKSEAEVYEAEISRERAEVEENPEEEIEEMSLFYQLQGFTPEESQKMAERLAQTARAIRAGDGAKRAWIVRASVSEPMDSATSAGYFNRCRRVHSDYSILFLGRSRRGNRFVRDQPGRPFCHRRPKIAHHHTFVVGLRFGDDLDWHHRCCSEVRPWSRLWSSGLATNLHGSDSSCGRSAGRARSTAHPAQERRLPDGRGDLACRYFSRAGKERVCAAADGFELHSRYYLWSGRSVSDFKNSGT